MTTTMIATNEKPRIGKCMATKLWYCIKDHVIGRGTTPKGAYTAMNNLHTALYRVTQ